MKEPHGVYVSLELTSPFVTAQKTGNREEGL